MFFQYNLFSATVGENDVQIDVFEHFFHRFSDNVFEFLFLMQFYLVKNKMFLYWVWVFNNKPYHHYEIILYSSGYVSWDMLWMGNF